MSSEVAIYDRMQEIVDLTLKGQRPSQVAKSLGIKTREVETVLDTWRELATDDRALKERGKQVVAGADEHFATLISKYYEIIDEVDASGATTPQMLAQKAGAIKGIADLEVKRATLLRDLGMITDADTATYQAELDNKITILEGILREVTSGCDRCRVKVHERLAEFSRNPRPVVIVQDGKA